MEGLTTLPKGVGSESMRELDRSLEGALAERTTLKFC